MLACLVVASSAAVFADLGTRSLWNDEIHSALIATTHSNFWSSVTTDGGNMALYYGLLRGMVAVFGNSVFVLRSVSAASAVATTAVVFLISRRMFGTRTAALSGAIVAVSPALVVWNQQARGYALGTFLVAASLLALMRAVDRPTTLRWCVYGLLVILSIYTLAYASMFLVSQALALMCWPRYRRVISRALAVTALATALAYVPLCLTMLRTGAAGILHLNTMSGSAARGILDELGLGRASDFFAPTALSDVTTVIAACCSVVAIAELTSRLRTRTEQATTVWLSVTLAWLVVPTVVDPIFSMTYKSIFESSFLVQSVPATAITVAFVLTNVLGNRLSWLAGPAFAVLLLVDLLPTYGVSYEEWSQASHYVATSMRPGDCITADKTELLGNIGYYLTSDAAVASLPAVVLPSRTWPQILSPTAQATPAAESYARVARACKRLWIVISRESPGQFLLVYAETTWFSRNGFPHITVKHFDPRYGFGINIALFSPGT